MGSQTGQPGCFQAGIADTTLHNDSAPGDASWREAVVEYKPMAKVSESWSVERVVEALPGGAPPQECSSPLAFFHMLERLKTTKREGWRRYGIER